MGVKKSVSKLKKEVDSWFSKYIRLRDATDMGVAQCFTCGKVDHYKKLQNGHFQSRRHHNTRWDEKNCQVQCVKCNMFGQGEQYKFGMYLDAKYGLGTAEELEFGNIELISQLFIVLCNLVFRKTLTICKQDKSSREVT